ncbi:MAG: heavy-metal-associated domain-containing protein [Hydrogenobaculum sp.]
MRKLFYIEGMTCMHCVNTVNKAIGALEGVKSFDTNLDKKYSEVEYDEAKLSEADIKSAIEEWGYKVVDIK